MNARTYRVAKISVVAAAVLLCVTAAGCKKSSRIKMTVDKADVVETNPTGLPVVPPPPVVITPDSPDDKLAEHFGIPVSEITRLREKHADFPKIDLPAGAADTQEPISGVPEDMAPTKTTVPGFTLIAGPEITGGDFVTPEQILEAARAARDLAFLLKVPVFTKPIVILNPHLEDPKGQISVLVGLPVPDDMPVPKGLHSVKVNGGPAFFPGRIDVKPLTIAPEARSFLEKETSVLAGAGTCRAAVLVIPDKSLDRRETPVGKAALFCL